MSYLMSQNIYI